MPESLPIAKGSRVRALLPRMANRHGLIAGTTGTVKTIALWVVAEKFSTAGVYGRCRRRSVGNYRTSEGKLRRKWIA